MKFLYQNTTLLVTLPLIRNRATTRKWMRELIHSLAGGNVLDEKQGRTKVYKSFGERRSIDVGTNYLFNERLPIPLRWRIELGRRKDGVVPGGEGEPPGRRLRGVWPALAASSPFRDVHEAGQVTNRCTRRPHDLLLTKG